MTRWKMKHLWICFILAGCCSPPIIRCDHPCHTIRRKVPKDRVGDILNQKNIPKWIIESYIEWVRYCFGLR